MHLLFCFLHRLPITLEGKDEKCCPPLQRLSEEHGTGRDFKIFSLDRLLRHAPDDGGSLIANEVADRLLSPPVKGHPSHTLLFSRALNGVLQDLQMLSDYYSRYLGPMFSSFWEVQLEVI